MTKYVSQDGTVVDAKMWNEIKVGKLLKLKDVTIELDSFAQAMFIEKNK